MARIIQIRQKTQHKKRLIPAFYLSAWMERLRGLLGTSPNHMPVLLRDCSSVHTFGMRYPIDVYFLSKDMKVLARRLGVQPNFLLACKKARSTLEIPTRQQKYFGQLPIDEHLEIKV